MRIFIKSVYWLKPFFFLGYFKIVIFCLHEITFSKILSFFLIKCFCYFFFFLNHDLNFFYVCLIKEIFFWKFAFHQCKLIFSFCIIFFFLLYCSAYLFYILCQYSNVSCCKNIFHFLWNFCKDCTKMEINSKIKI